MPNGSILWAFTDDETSRFGRAKDQNLSPSFNELLKSKGMGDKYQAHFFSDDCAHPGPRSAVKEPSGQVSQPYGPSGSNLASGLVQQTNDRPLSNLSGQIVLLPKSSDLDRTFDIIKPFLSEDLVTISRANGTLTGSRREFTLPVDSNITQIVLSTTFDSKGSVCLVRPSGIPVQPSDSGVVFAEISSGTIITVEAPEPGTWHFVLVGSGNAESGNFSMTAQAISSLKLFTFEFVELANPVHRAFVRIFGQPVIGSTPTGRAKLIGPIGTAQFRLVSEAGDTLQWVDLAQGSPDAAADEFFGSFSLPRIPFRVAVSGLDENGRAYERLFPTLFEVQGALVTLDPTTANDSVPIGTTTKLRFNLRNMGNPDNFKLQAIDTKGFVDGIGPDQLTLGTGEVGTFEVELAAPAGTAEARDTLVVTATSTTDLTSTNSATIEVTASEAANLHPIASAGPDQLDVFPGSSVTLDGSGSSDPDNRPAALTFTWTQIVGPVTILTGATTATPNFTPTEPGDYMFALIVSDGQASSFPDEVMITVQAREKESEDNSEEGEVSTKGE